MPKFLIEASYTAEGLKGLQKDKASGRQAAVTRIIKAAGGKLDAMYFALGDRDAIVIADLPDATTAASIALTVSATGMVRTKTTALLTIKEADEALGKGLAYRAPGQ